MSFHRAELDLSAQWKIQAHDEPLEKIIVLLDPGLQLATAHLGDDPLALDNRTVARQCRQSGGDRLPEPIQDTERILRLGAMAQLTLDRPCGCRECRPEGLFWQEGDITLIVPDPLLIERLTPD